MAETARSAVASRGIRRHLLPPALLAAASLLWVARAAALPPPQPVSPFAITGFVKSATLSGTDALAGGTLTVNEHVVTIPRNTIVLMPATALAWSELFTLAPAPYGPNQTGLALTDVPQPFTTWEVTVQGNRVGDEYIAGLVVLAQQSLMTGQGFINYIDYARDELRVGGVIGSPTTGTRIRINDPIGRFGRTGSPDVRFTIDEDNPTVRATTGYPMCLPRFDPRSRPDPLCPQTNRPLDPLTGLSSSIYTMPTPAAGVTPDATQQAPFEVGDYVTYAGELMKDGPEPTASPLPAAGQAFVSAWSVIANVGIFTTPGSDPTYVAIDVTILGVGGAPAPGLPQEATTRTRFEGFATDGFIGRAIDLFALDVDPCTGAQTERSWGSVDVDAGPLFGGAVKGRWRFRPPTKVLSLPAAGTFLPPTREVRARLRGASNPIVANGLVAGQYHAPILEYLFPENLAVGNPPVPLNLQDFPFLARGSGPWGGGGPNPVPSGIVGQLSPWPGNPAPTAATCTSGALAPPTAVASAPATATANATVTLDGSASTDPNGLALQFAWTQTAGPTVPLSSATVARPTFVAPPTTVGVTLGFSLVVTDTAGLVSSASSVTIVVNPAGAPQAPIANAGAPQAVAGGSLVQLDGTATTDPNAPPLALSYSWTQVAPLAPVAALIGANTLTPIFTAPLLPAGAQPVVMTFNLTVTNSAGLGSTSLVTVTVTPAIAPVANPGPPQVVASGALVTLDGSGSFDPAGLPLTYQWTQFGGPTATLSDPTSPTPTFTALTLPPGAASVQYGFSLTVSNGLAASTPAIVLVTVRSGVDIVVVLSAVYRVGKQRLTVTANSSDPSAVLTLHIPGMQGGVQLTLLAGVLTADIVGIAEPPSVTVTSSLGGSFTSAITRVR